MERKRERKLPHWLPHFLRARASCVCMRRNRKWSAPDLDFRGSSSNAIASTCLRHASRGLEADSGSFSVSSRESSTPHFSVSSRCLYPPRAALASSRPDLRDDRSSTQSPRRFGHNSPQNPFTFSGSSRNMRSLNTVIALQKSSAPVGPYAP